MESVVLKKIQFSCLGVSCLLFVGGASNSVLARQNIVSAEISARYDYQERDYDEVSEAPADQGRTVHTDRQGDERNYIVSPRVSFSSSGESDVFQLTVAPALNYDDIYGTTDLDWDFRIQEEKQLTQNWSLNVEDNYFLGDDPDRQDELQGEEISPGGIQIQELEVVGAPGEDDNVELTRRYGRTRYWTNDFLIGTQYGYAEDSIVGIGYGYGVLRNDGDEDVYTEYDRNDIWAELSYRFNPKWRVENSIRYSRGTFDTPVTVNPVEPEDNNDLDEYDAQVRLNYYSTPHLQYFTEYRYLAADYDVSDTDDYTLHELRVGVDYDYSPRLSFTFSGGPAIGSYDNSSTDTSYVAYGGLRWAVERGDFTLGAGKGFSQNDFDGRGSGLTDYWSTGAAFNYQLSESFHLTLSADYDNYDRMQIADRDGIAPVETPEFGSTAYTEEAYSAGIQLTYIFARWYQLSGGYRYTKNESDLQYDYTGNYEEDQFFIELSWGKEVFRW